MKTDIDIHLHRIAEEFKEKYASDPRLLLFIHALSSCDSTSSIKNIKKDNIFRACFSNVNGYVN